MYGLLPLIYFTVLHPSFKLEYFKRLNWEKDWVKKAVDITRQAWEDRYKRETSSTLNDSGTTTPNVCDIIWSIVHNIYLSILQVTKTPVNTFISFMSSQTRAASQNNDTDQFDRYLADSCIQTDDPLQWWLVNRKLYPDLARLAISIHCVMGTCLVFLSSKILTNLFCSVCCACRTIIFSGTNSYFSFA